jgi:hypothetical protein
MKTRPIQAATRRGSALTSAVVLSAVITGLVAVGLSTSIQRSFSASKLSNRMRSTSIAEAGANKAYSILTTNFALASNPAKFPKTSFGGGFYDADVKLPSANLAVIHSTGTYQNASSDVILEVRRYTSGSGQTGETPAGYGYVMLAGGILDWRGNVNLDMGGAWMHANSTYYMNGVQALKASVSACTSISGVGGSQIVGDARSRAISATVTGTATITNVPPVAIPNIDLTPYYNWALAKGQVFNSKSLSGTVTPNGGVMWVNGTLTLGNGVYTGCFIATAGIEMKTTGNGEIIQKKVAKYPAFVCRDGSILIKQAKTFSFEGLIYCKTGSFDKQANGDAIGKGAIIAAGNITKNGGWSVMMYENSMPIPPGTPTNTTDIVSVEAWQK